MPIDFKVLLADIDAVLAEYGAMRGASKYDDCSDQGKEKVAQMATMLAASIDRCAPPGSRYLETEKAVLQRYDHTRAMALAPLAGILTAIRQDIAAGRISTVAELIHAEIFGNFLDMADHLLKEAYKDPAAVLVGGVLEEHLRKLCDKHSVAKDIGGKPKKADAMNADLAGVGAFSKADQKNVTAWLGVRNEAAHGHYASYTLEQVRLLSQSVRDFITRVPA